MYRSLLQRLQSSGSNLQCHPCNSDVSYLQSRYGAKKKKTMRPPEGFIFALPYADNPALSATCVGKHAAK